MPSADPATHLLLARNTNQALGIGQYAIDFLAGRLGSGPSKAVLERTELFHTDSVLCGLSALALGTNAPTLLRAEALEYPASSPERGACVFGSSARVAPEKAAVANIAAVREWDSNGTNFGYWPALGHTAGEFGHNDFYPVAIAVCQQRTLDGSAALRAMVCLDEIRGRLASVFSLKSYKIDHVVHGAIASAAVFGALLGATAQQIEHAIGMFVAHYIPWRAIRAGKQLSDSKGASAALSTEAAILSMNRAMRGFVGPKDIFRNPESLFRQFHKTTGDSPFDLVLAHSGADFAVMGMHFKLGLYEHQSAGALQGLINLICKAPTLLEAGGARISKILIKAYEPAFGIIGDPAKRNPTTRQSADHSMLYIVATMLRKAIDSAAKGQFKPDTTDSHDAVWKQLMLAPWDYAPDALNNSATRALMAKITFEHGGPEYDARYPDGIPTSIIITDTDGAAHDSALVMYPAGHARNTSANLRAILDHKFHLLGALALDTDKLDPALRALANLSAKSAADITNLYNIPFTQRPNYE